MDNKKVPIITKDEAISKLRMFQSLIASPNLEDKKCVVALQMGICAIQQPEIVLCKNCRLGEEWGQLISCGLMKGSHKPNWYCADGEPKDGDENETAEKVN